MSNTTHNFPVQKIDEAIDLFVGYWAQDYEMCDKIARENNFPEDEFKTAVYTELNKRLKKQRNEAN